MANRKDARLERLRVLVSQRRSLHLREAADVLDVSEMTVRRDIRENAEHFAYLGGHIVPADRVWGAAPYELARAAERHEAEKRRACAHALGFVRPDATVFVDCGTTLPHLVDLIPAERPVTVVCYALNVADRATRRPNVALILLGGAYHPSSASFAALGGRPSLDDLAIDVAFLSAAGVDPRLGATCANFHEAAWKRAAMAKSRLSVLVIDRSKLGRTRPAAFATLGEFDHAVCEDGPLPLPIAREDEADAPEPPRD